jgi:hypothetical protein
MKVEMFLAIPADRLKGTIMIPVYLSGYHVGVVEKISEEVRESVYKCDVNVFPNAEKFVCDMMLKEKNVNESRTSQPGS